MLRITYLDHRGHFTVEETNKVYADGRHVHTDTEHLPFATPKDAWKFVRQLSAHGMGIHPSALIDAPVEATDQEPIIILLTDVTVTVKDGTKVTLSQGTIGKPPSENGYFWFGASTFTKSVEFAVAPEDIRATDYQIYPTRARPVLPDPRPAIRESTAQQRGN